MTRVAILRFVGDLQQGLQVTLEWGHSSEAIEGRRLGQLAANPMLTTLYGNWQRAYRNLEKLYRLEIEPPSNGGSREDCDDAAAALGEQLNHWLNEDSRNFKDISLQLHQELSRHPNSQVLIQTDNPQLQRLPWHLWTFWQYHEDVQVILSPLQYQEIQFKSQSKQPRVLAILGNSSEINITIDRQLLQQVPGIHPESCFLEEPTRTELVNALCAPSGWDILFFAGHSRSEQESQVGRIYLNSTESITLDELKKTLKQAIAQGLRLAIFNSCDGLGLANSLAELQIPQTIFMREPVPDEVAHCFLASFLESFSQGNPLVQAVKQARERLESIQKKLPYATWLPVLYQHPRAQTFIWPSAVPQSGPRSRWSPWVIGGLSLTGLFLAGTLWGRANLPKTQALGDGLSAGEELLDQTAPHRLKELGVQEIAFCQSQSAQSSPYWKLFQHRTQERWERCIQDRSSPKKAADYLLQSWQEETHDPETLIYLNNAFLEAHNLDSLTIAIAVPILKNADGSMKDADLAQELLRGIAQAQTEVNLSLTTEIDAPGPGMYSLSLPGQNILMPRLLHPGVGLKVVILDDANDTRQVKQQAQMLIQQKEVLGLVGHYTSEMTMATVDLYNRQGLTMVSPGSTTEELSDEPRPYFFRTVPTAGTEAQSLVDHLVQQGYRNVVVMYNPQSPFTDSLWREFRQRFTAAYADGTEQPLGDRPQIKSINLAAKGFNPEKVLAKINRSSETSKDSPNQTAIVLVPDGQVTDAFDNAVEIVRLNQGRHLIAGSWGLYSLKTLETKQAESFKKFVISVPWHPASSPNPDFPDQANKLWGGPVNTRTATAYDAAVALIEAIAQQEQPTRAGVQQQLAAADFSFTGATGDVVFEPNSGNRLPSPQTLVHVLPCANRDSGWAFVPLQFPTTEAAGLSCRP